MTKKECIKNHRIMWNWLADNPDKGKQDWPGWEDEGLVRNHCFLCEYTISHNLPCKECLVDWGTIPNHCGSYYAPYTQYQKTEDLSKKAYYARKIANLKERERDYLKEKRELWKRLL